MKKWIPLIAIALILAYLIFWRISLKNAETAKMGNMRAMGGRGAAAVLLEDAKVLDLHTYFEAAGSLEAPLNVNIAPKITGRIAELTVREGDKVKKGQLLVRIDAADVEAAVQQQTANLAEAQYRLAQAKLNQNPTDVAVNTQIAQQKAALASAEADFKQVQATQSAELAAAQANIRQAKSTVENSKADIKGVQANIDNLQVKYDRAQSLFDKGYVSAQSVDDARTALTVGKSNLEIAQAKHNASVASLESVEQKYNTTRAKLEADVEASRAKLTQVKAALESATANVDQKKAFRQSIAALEAGVEASKASLASAKAKRADTQLFSPLDGYVTQRHADPGAIASPNQPVLSVQFMQQIWVSVGVPEEICNNLHIGQTAKVKLDALPGQEFEAKIIQINPSADSQSRQFQVRVIMDNSSNKLKPGMFASVTLVTGTRKNAVVVPREALLTDEDGSYVMGVDSESKAVHIPVTPMGQNDKYVDVGNALKPGQKVVVMTTNPVREGQEISTGGGKEGAPGGPPGSKGGKQPEGGRPDAGGRPK